MRARMIKLRQSTTKKLWKLKKEAERVGEYRVAKRIHAVLLNASGMRSGSIAHSLNSARSKISEWLMNYESHGFEALLEGKRTGRPCLLNQRQKSALSDIIESGPLAYGFLSSLWTCPMISRVISEEFNVDYHVRHILRLLNQLNFSLQRPRRRLLMADPRKQNRWRRYIYPNIKKKPPRKTL
jgi:transposase